MRRWPSCRRDGRAPPSPPSCSGRSGRWRWPATSPRPTATRRGTPTRCGRPHPSSWPTPRRPAASPTWPSTARPPTPCGPASRARSATSWPTSAGARRSASWWSASTTSCGARTGSGGWAGAGPGPPTTGRSPTTVRDGAGVDDPVALARAIAGMTVVVPAWGHDAHRAAPVADRATIVSLCDALLVAAGGSLTPRALARAIGHRLGVGQAPLSLEVAALDAGGASGAAVLADSTADEALRLRRAAEVVDELNDRERLSLAYPELTVRQLAPVLGASPSQAHTVRARAAQVVRAELLDDDDAEGVALLVMELSRNWADAVDNRRRVRRSARAMSVFGPAHPLDVDLADDALSPAADSSPPPRLLRLPAAAGPPPPRAPGRPPPRPGAGGGRVRRCRRPGAGRGSAYRPSTRCGGPAPTTDSSSSSCGLQDGRVLVAPVTFDVEAADDETLVVEPTDLGLAVAVHPRLATEVPASALVERIVARARRGRRPSRPPRRRPVRPPHRGPPAPRRPHRRARRAAAARPVHRRRRAPAPSRTGPVVAHRRPPRLSGPDVRGPPPRRLGRRPRRPPGGMGAHRHHRRGGRGPGGVRHAPRPGRRHRLRRRPLGAHPLQRHRPGGAGRGRQRHRRGFDSSSLNYGIDAPSGRHTAPRPLISGLAPFDAIAKFLDQSSGTRMTAPPSRGAVTRVDVDDILREAAGAAAAELVRQGSKFRIAPQAAGLRVDRRRPGRLGRGPGPRLRSRAHDRPRPARAVTRRP